MNTLSQLQHMPKAVILERIQIILLQTLTGTRALAYTVTVEVLNGNPFSSKKLCYNQSKNVCIFTLHILFTVSHFHPFVFFNLFLICTHRQKYQQKFTLIYVRTIFTSVYVFTFKGNQKKLIFFKASDLEINLNKIIN